MESKLYNRTLFVTLWSVLLNSFTCKHIVAGYVSSFAKISHLCMHTMAKKSFHHQWITSAPLPDIDRSTFAKGCFWALSNVHECSGVPLVGCWNYWPTYRWYRSWIYLHIFCDSLITMGPPCRPFHLKNFWVLL